MFKGIYTFTFAHGLWTGRWDRSLLVIFKKFVADLLAVEKFLFLLDVSDADKRKATKYYYSGGLRKGVSIQNIYRT